MSSSGPVETEIRQPFRRREKLRLSLHLQRAMQPTDCNPAKVILEQHVRTISADELARKMNLQSGSKFLLLDCRGYLCYTDCHIRGAVHIACSDRFNRRRVQNTGASILDLISMNGRRSKGSNGCPMSPLTGGKLREVIVYDEGITDLNLEDSSWSNPTSFVIAHLIRENRQPTFLKGGIKEFSRYYSDLCENFGSHPDLSMDTSSPASFGIPPPLTLLSAPLFPLPPLSPTPSDATSNQAFENEPPTQVLPFLFVGNARDANDADLLRRLGISYVLSVTTTSPLPFKSGSGPIKMGLADLSNQEPEFHTKLIPVSDNLVENLAPYFEEACDFIEEARTSGTRVLIHCHAGISRSPTIAIAYIMKHINLSTLDAYAFVQKYRRIISPNLNFMGQLIEYETKLKGHSSQVDSSCSNSTSSNSSDTSNGSDH